MSIFDSIPIISSHRKSNRADDIISSSKRYHRRAISHLEATNADSKKSVDDLFDLKVNCATNVIENAINTLEKCQKVNRKETKVAQDSIGFFHKKALPALKKQSVSISDIATEGVKGTAAGAALSLGSVSAVSALGAASTGTAISTLSGAAASNATLAWFGGGALSAGGAGVAGGAMVLGGIALAPVLIIGAFKYASHAEKKLTEAIEFRDNVEEAVAKIDAAIAVAKSMNKHVELFSQTLMMLRERLISLSENLSSLLLDSNADDHDVNITKYQLILFIKAVKRLLDVNLFDSNQNPTPESLRIIGHVLYTDQDSSLALAKNIEQGNKIHRPDGINYLSEIEPGTDSPAFFWMLDSYAEYKPKPKSKTKKSNDNLTFKDTLILLAMSFIGLFISLYCDSLLFTLISIFAIIASPLIWLSAKVEEGGTAYNILGLILLATGAFLTYIYI